MDPYGRSRSRPPSDRAPDWNAPPVAAAELEDSMWQLGLGVVEAYPERPGEVDCVYYLRTGFCRYGARCRYNHPRDRSAVAGVIGSGGGYPERVGQPVCQYFIKTGICKYGATCKYHHPRDGGLSASTVSLNYHGYPLRPGEKECSYYVKTGQCKFGVICKFHHPQPAGISMSPTAPTFYPTVQSPAVPSSQYGIASWQVARPPPVPGSYVQGPYSPMLLSPAVVRFPGWGPYSPPVSPVVHLSAQQTVGLGWMSGRTHQLSPSAPAYTGPYSSFSSAAVPSSFSPKEYMFPERPGQPECQFYMRTGDCKYGSSCRYHHPTEWSMPKSNCVLSSIGLPLRPGVQPCTFYVQHGVCKFGPTCKFDHPMGTLSYSPSASSLADMPVAPYPVGLSLGTLAPFSTSELRCEFVAGSTKNSSLTRMPSSENKSSGLVSSIFSRASVSFPQSHVKLTGQSSAPSSGSSGIGRGSES